MEDSALSVELVTPIGKDQKKQKKLSFTLLEKDLMTKKIMEALTWRIFHTPV